MDTKKAALKLKHVIEERVRAKEEDEFYVYGSRHHLLWMCHRLIEKDFDGFDQRVEGEKAHRWIGWIQGCLYMSGVVTLDEMKELNKDA